MSLALTHARLVPSPASPGPDAVLIRGDRDSPGIGPTAYPGREGGRRRGDRSRGARARPGVPGRALPPPAASVGAGPCAAGRLPLLEEFLAGVEVGGGGRAPGRAGGGGELGRDRLGEAHPSTPAGSRRARAGSPGDRAPRLRTRRGGERPRPRPARRAVAWIRPPGLLDEGPVVVLDAVPALAGRSHRGGRAAGVAWSSGSPRRPTSPPQRAARLGGLARSGLLRIDATWPRVPVAPEVLDRAPRNDRFHVCGVKLFSDGAIGGRSAALLSVLRSPGRPGPARARARGLQGRDPPEHDRGHVIAAHAIGDRAIREGVSTAPALPGEVAARQGRRHRALRARPRGGPGPAAGARGVVASVQPNFLRWAGPSARPRSEPGACARIFSWIVRNGARICWDRTGCPPDRCTEQRQAIAHPVDAERISDETALRLYTEAAADATAPAAAPPGRGRAGQQLVVLPAMPSRSSTRKTWT